MNIKSKARPLFTQQDHHNIIDLVNKGQLQKNIAQRYHCSPSTISDIVNKKVPSIEFFLATKQDYMQANLDDPKRESNRSRAGRLNRKSFPNTKLSSKKAAQIRKIYFSGKMKQIELAAKFGVSQFVISKIISGLIWKSL